MKDFEKELSEEIAYDPRPKTHIGTKVTFLAGNDYISGEIESINEDRTVNLLCPLAQRWKNVPIDVLEFP